MSKFGPKPKPIAERFWSKVQKSDGCWLWTGATTPEGYGKLGQGRHTLTQLRANRISWELHFGPVPNALEVLHKCDAPRCVRPDHLFLGTQRDNALDMHVKGRNRQPHGEAHGMAKLKVPQILEIRRRAASGEKQRDLAAEFSVAKSLIGRIVLKQAWAHI